MTRRLSSIAFLVLVLVGQAGCGSDDPESGESSPRPEPTVTSDAPSEVTSPSEAVDPIVGEWSRTTTCADRIAAMGEAGMEEYAVASTLGQGFIPGVSRVSQLEDPDRPCLGAEPQLHSHFFTGAGEFGSLDQNGEVADSGTYELPSAGVVVISNPDVGSVTFEYVVADGALSLEPQLPGCASRGCFPAEWAVAVSYLGLPWKAVTS